MAAQVVGPVQGLVGLHRWDNSLRVGSRCYTYNSQLWVGVGMIIGAHPPLRGPSSLLWPVSLSVHLSCYLLGLLWEPSGSLTIWRKQGH